jgi:hypothetical protein
MRNAGLLPFLAAVAVHHFPVSRPPRAGASAHLANNVHASALSLRTRERGNCSASSRDASAGDGPRGAVGRRPEARVWPHRVRDGYGSCEGDTDARS